MRYPVIRSFPDRSTADEAITAADIEAWARVERALTGKREACRKLRAAARIKAVR